MNPTALRPAGSCLSLVLIAASLPLSLGATDIGSINNPYKNDAVTATTLDLGNVFNRIDTGTAANFDDSSYLYIGYSNSGNNLTISGGAVLNDFWAYLGFNESSDYNTLTVTGAGSTLANSYRFTVGEYGSYNSVLIADGASITTPNCYISGNLTSVANHMEISGGATLTATEQVFVGTYGTNASLYVHDGGKVTGADNLVVGFGESGKPAIGNDCSAVFTGSGSSFNLKQTLVVGDYGVRNRLVMSDGATGTVPNLCVGVESVSENETLFLSGAGTTLTSTYLSVSHSGSATNSIVIANGALLKVGLGDEASVSLPGTNDIRLANGVFALNDGTDEVDFWKSSYLTHNRIVVWNDATASWDAATALNVTMAYDDPQQPLQTFLPYVDILSGFTVMTGGDKLHAWSNSDMVGDGWFVKGWYGCFYTDVVADWGHWIWHSEHGWQYVVPTDGGIYVWDDATWSWWFTGADFYPAMYSFAHAKWYCYQSGATPDRTFWEYAASTSRAESLVGIK